MKFNNKRKKFGKRNFIIFVSHNNSLIIYTGRGKLFYNKKCSLIINRIIYFIN